MAVDRAPAHETERIALPNFVLNTIAFSRTISRTETNMIRIESLLIVTLPTSCMFDILNISGNLFGVAPKAYSDCPPYSRKSETPIAVIREVRREYLRTGL